MPNTAVCNSQHLLAHNLKVMCLFLIRQTYGCTADQTGEAAMDIRNRMADVVKLRCNALQDFFEMIKKENWKQELYNTAEGALGTKFQAKYITAYEAMREAGIDSYQVEDMDVTLIVELIGAERAGKFYGINPVERETYKAVLQVKDDRNSKDHSGENEEPDVLYLTGLLSLCNVKRFVRTVDRYETSIEEAERLSYRRKYIEAADELMNTIDAERMDYLLQEKEIEVAIRRIRESKAPSREFHAQNRAFMERYWRFGGNGEKYYDFLIQASDAGIKYADYLAISATAYKEDYEETDRRLIEYLKTKTPFDRNDCHAVLNIINRLLEQGREMTVKMEEVIQSLKEKGFGLETTDEGMYFISGEIYFPPQYRRRK